MRKLLLILQFRFLKCSVAWNLDDVLSWKNPYFDVWNVTLNFALHQEELHVRPGDPPPVVHLVWCHFCIIQCCNSSISAPTFSWNSWWQTCLEPRVQRCRRDTACWSIPCAINCLSDYLTPMSYTNNCPVPNTTYFAGFRASSWIREFVWLWNQYSLTHLEKN